MAEGGQITYEQLFELLRLEKNKPSLQKLSPTFFSDVAVYVAQKQQMIAESKQAGHKEEIAKQLGNVQKILKMIYDFREKKILTLAVNKSRTASNLIDTSGLHPKEEQFFDQLIEVLQGHRKGILEALIEGKLSEKEQAKKVVKFLADVEQFVDPNMRTYGPFKESDVTDLPPMVADMLYKQKKVDFV